MERQVRYAVALVLLTQTVLCFAHAGGREHFEWSAKKGEEAESGRRRAPFSFTLPELGSLPDHPRLRVRDEKELISILNYTGNDPVAAKLLDDIYSYGDEILNTKPALRPAPGPSGVLSTVRTVLDRVYIMALLFRLTNNCNSTWYYRGWAELETVAKWSDWNPQHFLDVGEMTHAVAIGYDWFYQGLNSSQRMLLEDAIVEKGFKPAMAAFKQHEFWTYYDSNWNNVCNGGLIVGALALLDNERHSGIAKEMLNMSMHALPNSMASYAPLGAWPEGPGYWAYATDYTRYAISSLQTALGTDMGLGEFTGFATTADFNIQLQGTSLINYNWADDRVGEHPSDTAVSFYLATHYNRPEAAYLQREKLKTRDTISVNDLIDYTDKGSEADLEKLPLVMLYWKRNLLVARGSWTNRTAAFLGLKGGNVSYHHSHMDLGSFVLEMGGVRWAMELGSDNYGLPEYFGGKRFTYYRLRNVGHNTLTFDDDNQGRESAAEIIAYSSDHNQGTATVDLTTGYAPSNLTSVKRTFKWALNNNAVTIEDAITYGKSHAKTVTWAMHTRARAMVHGTSADLTDDHRELHVAFDSGDKCPHAEMAVSPVDLKPPQDSSTGIFKLTITAPASTCSSIVVHISLTK
ncbi:uncharacterized protein LOC135823242 [Sycon ciliatum]|uniref:uncharacterized protein LOC135823242 n=1 Tax=Sycon ciliatum TaxID=27933 RepID=UPI0031F6633C